MKILSTIFVLTNASFVRNKSVKSLANLDSFTSKGKPATIHIPCSSFHPRRGGGLYSVRGSLIAFTDALGHLTRKGFQIERATGPGKFLSEGRTVVEGGNRECPSTLLFGVSIPKFLLMYDNAVVYAVSGLRISLGRLNFVGNFQKVSSHFDERIRSNFILFKSIFLIFQISTDPMIRWTVWNRVRFFIYKFRIEHFNSINTFERKKFEHRRLIRCDYLRPRTGKVGHVEGNAGGNPPPGLARSPGPPGDTRKPSSEAAPRHVYRGPSLMRQLKRESVHF